MTDISKYKRIHCLGIGGIGLSAVAEILNNAGYIVTGTDMKKSEVTEHLESIGIKVYYKHAPENVEGVDLIVYSVAVADDNPEMVRARELGIPEITRAQMLGAIMEHFQESVAICGTHGKTTTTSMISLILRNADYKPTILVGGNVPEIDGNVEIGEHKYFVTEACEYMDSFLNLRPSIGVLLNIDSDHLDYFKDIDHIKASFRQFVTQIPEDGTVVAYGENPFVKEVLRGVKNTITYGYSEGNKYYAENISFDESGYPEYDICSNGETLCHIHLGVPGEHNVLNSMAAYATCHFLGVSDEVICDTLMNFHGPHRRFDFIGVTDNGVKVIDDYAHHPTEIKATLKAARNVKHNKLWCIFQPHTYTRTKALFDQFEDAFTDVDTLIVTDIYAAREKDVYGVSSYKLVQAMKEKHPEMDINYIQDFPDIARFITRHAGKDDIVITMGAGDVYKVGKIILGTAE